MKHSTKIDVLDVLPSGEAEEFIDKALHYIEANSDDLIEEYELCILVDYESEPRPVSVEVSGCRGDMETGIEPVVHAANAEFWTVYKRMLNDVGDTPTCAVSDHRSLAAASLEARRLAERHDVPYTGVEMTNLDIRRYRQ